MSGETRGEGYLTDVAYVRTYVPDLAPAGLRAVAALNGFSPPRGEGFDYCELGFGSGDTLLTLAAACPDARFVGVDLLPDHVARARAVAARGGLDNVRLIEGDFADLGGESLPDFDYITAHGVLSWVSPDKRRAALDLAAARLRPGGLLYASYNALPGWAAVAPLRRLLLDAGSTVAGDSLARARHGVRVATLLRDAGAEYFRSNPASVTMLDTMARMGDHYVAHEYLHGDWVPMFFADVAREMAHRGLYYVGQLPLALNYRDLALPPRLGELFKGVTNRLELESLKDFALNEFFRRDVYIKGSAACSLEHAHAHVQSTPFTAVSGGAPVGRDLALTHHSLRFAGPLFDALLPALERSSATAAELARLPALSGFGVRAVGDALMRLLLGPHVWPARSSVAPAPPPPLDARYRVPLAHNRAALDELAAPIVLASPVLGTGVQLSLVQAICLRALTEAEPAARAAWLRDLVRRHPLRLLDGERVVHDPLAQQEAIAAELARSAPRLAELVRLGVVAAA